MWCLEFSPCGRYLASGAKSNSVHVYKVDASQRVSIHRRLQILADITGVSSISWSQDSSLLTVSTPEENNTGVFVFNVPKGTLEREFKFYGQDTFSVASFFKDNSHKFAAGDQKGHFSFYVCFGYVLSQPFLRISIAIYRTTMPLMATSKGTESELCIA